jgi:hypothetical protein
MINIPTRFDDSLPNFAQIVVDELGEKAVHDNFFLRDSSGRLTYITLARLDDRKREAISNRAATLKPYVYEESAVVFIDDLFDERIKDEDDAVFERVDHPNFSGFVRLIERRIVAQDWLEGPQAPLAGLPPIAVFASHKGGVGRSTALAVAASTVAGLGLDVLVLDLDLEAPGLDGIFLSDEGCPKYGTLDYFVESVLGEIDEEFLTDMVGVSPLTQGKGRIHVCPAIGATGKANPQNVLGKIARAYLDTPTADGENISFLKRTRSLVHRLSKLTRYDVIFIDARAGLNEATAAAVLGLGADVLLFGVDSPQTFSGYRYFLSYLDRFRPQQSDAEDWRARLRMVHAKASPDGKKQAEYRTQSFELFADTIYDLELRLEETSFNFDYDDEAAPHFAWPILNDANYLEFNPLTRPDQFSKALSERTFGPFVKALIDRLNLRTK